MSGGKIAGEMTTPGWTITTGKSCPAAERGAACGNKLKKLPDSLVLP
jgi:hypothetical protein